MNIPGLTQAELKGSLEKVYLNYGVRPRTESTWKILGMQI
jgi:hypothetical protein